MAHEAGERETVVFDPHRAVAAQERQEGCPGIGARPEEGSTIRLFRRFRLAVAVYAIIVAD
ncbi:MAG TPA: hypothetical protein VHN14_06785 [Kofleriaceae bacterium]|jgi:hypothetical protein|nr:hypothetical protein [Kofleriaceae bacterium]